MKSIIIGIVNVTPDSFSDGGRFCDIQAAVAHGLKLIKDGADILDVGGESTRPGAEPVSIDEELSRVIPVIEGLVGKTQERISIDTRKPEVARQAVEAGAELWNDVSALTYNEDSLTTAAALDVPVILMHAQGLPETMQTAPSYRDVVEEVKTYLLARAEAAIAVGVRKEQIILDPGIGFGKSLQHNIELFQRLGDIVGLGFPVLLGASRKRFIGDLDGNAEADQRLGGSLAAVLHGARAGVQLFRVHDVAETRQALTVWRALQG